MISNSENRQSFNSIEESLQPIAAFVESQKIDFDQYPYLVALINNPKDKALAEKALNHYSSVLEKLQNLHIDAINSRK